ncbi:MAG: type II secretion system GspH family protein [Fimbriimonadaceae bacterium]|nr:type II secretion system GspH family protein [Fimbriimonadaceae bacterium]
MARRGFTLIELLVVIAVIAILAGILFPVFARAKFGALKTSDLSNLKQIGLAAGLYMADSDDLFPNAVDAADRWATYIWSSEPEFMAQIPFMPLMNEALQPYAKSEKIFHSPVDRGTEVLDSHPEIDFPSTPTMWGVYGLSYFFRTELTFERVSQSSLQAPAETNFMWTAGGHWLGEGGPMRSTDGFDAMQGKLFRYRYNVLFADFHAKNESYSGLQEAWRQRL